MTEIQQGLSVMGQYIDQKAGPDASGAAAVEKPYQIFRPGEVDDGLFGDVITPYHLTPETPVLMLPYGEHDRVGFEIRKLYFASVVGPDGILNSEAKLLSIADAASLPTTRIVSFGDCNVACGYCKRDMQFIGDDGVPMVSIPIPFIDIARLAEGAVDRGEIVRFSGGDPVMFPNVTLALAEYLDRRYGAKVSIAHNGSGTKWVSRLVPYLSSAAIDLKAVPEKIGEIMGVNFEQGKKLFARSLTTQGIVSGNGILLDVRTPVFGNTSSSDMDRLATAIEGANDLRYTFWTWRMYKPVVGCDYPVPTREYVMGIMQEVSAKHPSLWMGMRAKWNLGGMVFVREGDVITETSDTQAQVGAEYGSGNIRLDISFEISREERMQFVEAD